MGIINKILTGFLYDGGPLALASAPWKNNARAIYGFNAAGTAYQVFKPGNRFNSLTELRQDGSYTLEAVAPGFELPGATLAIVPAGPALGWPAVGSVPQAGPISVTDIATSGDSTFGYRLFFTASSSDASDLDLLLIGEGTMATRSSGNATGQVIRLSATPVQFTVFVAAPGGPTEERIAWLINRNGSVHHIRYTVTQR